MWQGFEIVAGEVENFQVGKDPQGCDILLGEVVVGEVHQLENTKTEMHSNTTEKTCKLIPCTKYVLRVRECILVYSFTQPFLCFI